MSSPRGRAVAEGGGAICYTEAVAAALIAWAVLGERLSPLQMTGGAVVLAGAYIAQRAAARPGPGPGTGGPRGGQAFSARKRRAPSVTDTASSTTVTSAPSATAAVA